MIKPTRFGYYLECIKILLKKLEWRYPLTVKETGLKFEIRSIMDLLVLKEVLLDDDYKLQELTDQDKIIADVGGGWGDYSITAARKLPASRIYVWEPDKKYYGLLIKNIRKNKIKNIKAFNMPVTSLEQIFKTVKNNQIAVLKMDCEGAEYKILNTGRARLKQINKIVMEFHCNESNNEKKLTSWLNSAGFKIQVVSQRGVDNLGLLYGLR